MPELSEFPPIRRGPLMTLQVNLGYRCNQSCLHCHVEAGPRRDEMMDRATADDVLAFLYASRVRTLDLTGGAPELNPNFRHLVQQARCAGVEVIDRCNLTVLLEPGQEDLAGFLAANRVEVVASLPCYLEQNVDAQRGSGVFERSVEVLRLLNGIGYGKRGSGLVLSLVFNPQGPKLPSCQVELEASYKSHLGDRYGIEFNRLLTLTNMPIGRFARTLEARGEFDVYARLLRDSSREENLREVMCRSLVSVDWQGRVYDCDFNQMLGLPMAANGTPRPHLRDLYAEDLEGNSIVVADHCYGCTAGQGSSCGGALS